MKKVRLVVLTSSVAIAALIFGLRALIAQQGDESVAQNVAQDAPSGGPPSGRPPNGRPPNGDRREEDLGEPIASTEAETRGVLCDVSTDMLNEQLDMQSEAQWSCSDGLRQLVTNGVPNHPTGEQFVAEGGRIATHEVNVAMPLTPVTRTGTGQQIIEIAYALNGVLFNPGTGGRCASDVTDISECSQRPGSVGQWTIEALGQSSFDFGEDHNHAHVQRGGVYHYHGIPEGMLSEENLAGESMQLIGWAVDGFPLYARYGYSEADAGTGALRAMDPSYQLKATPDSERPNVDLIPMGTFSEDYEYVEGSGDLDECNGRFAVTPEFPQGIYHYYATDTYPFVQRCVKGTPDPSSRPVRGGGDPNGGPRPERPNGGPRSEGPNGSPRPEDPSPS
ncbi:MAG: YHYH protein [Cyanobacteria bacterium P01_A01_bin.116]